MSGSMWRNRLGTCFTWAGPWRISPNYGHPRWIRSVCNKPEYAPFTNTVYGPVLTSDDAQRHLDAT